ncbi:MAG TPA: membrane protein insertase YidC [Verrucomicrobiae bacterium]|nr:membrane protein insertase YidC [Verrucomicrobiae bacterium]
MEQRNLIIAMVLMAVIWISYFTFFAPQTPQTPPPEQAPATSAQTEQSGQSTTTTAPDATAASTPVSMDRETALKQSPRLRIETPRISGSIALKGARLDDVVLTDYHETVDPKSANVIMLSPPGAPDAYFAEVSWNNIPNGNVILPDADSLWQADRDVLTPEQPVTLTWNNGAGLTFKRIIAIDRNYMFTVEQHVANSGTAPVTLLPYARIHRTGTPKTAGYTILHEGLVGIFNGTKSQESFSGMHKEGAQQQEFNSTGGWLGITDKYWLAAVVAPNDAHFRAHFLHKLDGQVDAYQTDYIAAEGVAIPPGGTATATSRVFAGAKEVKLLKAYTDAGIPLFDFAVDWGYFRFLTKPIFYVLDWLYGLVGNFGIAIMLLTVLVKLLFFPLANKSYTAMSKMKRLTPQMQALRERLGDDKTKLNQEMMALYKREKVNPAAGCLPIVVQIPVFFALYKVLIITIEMRHAPFFGWIQDLSVPDPTTMLNLFGLLPWHVPIGADQFVSLWGLGAVPVVGHMLAGLLAIISIGVWPLIMGVTMFLQQKINPPPPDPVQARMFMMLPFVFTFMLGQFAAGLVIYWAWNNLLSIAQQWVIMRRVNAQASSAARS